MTTKPITTTVEAIGVFGKDGMWHIVNWTFARDVGNNFKTHYPMTLDSIGGTQLKMVCPTRSGRLLYREI